MDKDVDKALTDIRNEISEMITHVSRQIGELSTQVAQQIGELARARDEIHYGASAALAELYRLNVQYSPLTKEEAISRLEAQKASIAYNIPGQPGLQFLDYMITVIRAT